MTSLLLLVPLSLMLLAAIVWAFAWAVRRGQFDDLDTPALDILRDDYGDQAREAGGAGSANADGSRRHAD